MSCQATPISPAHLRIAVLINPRPWLGRRYIRQRELQKDRTPLCSVCHAAQPKWNKLWIYKFTKLNLGWKHMQKEPENGDKVSWNRALLHKSREGFIS